ncbi:DNA polymerase III subunit beta [candidate division KSB1 bacterium]|nr:DNA polymerase III subunit beta [candidate division KSB1 bacterium]
MGGSFMNFSISKSVFHDSLNKVIGVVPQKTTISVLTCILLDLDGNQLSLMGTDLEISIKTLIEVDGTEDGTVAVPAKILADIVRELPDIPLTLYTESGNKLVLKTEKGEYKISTQPKEDFPKVNVEEDGFEFDMATDVLVRMTNQTIFAVSMDELRPALTGINMEMLANELRFVATDGHRLSKIILSDFEGPEDLQKNMIIPTKTLNLLLRNADPEKQESISIRIGEDHIVFNMDKSVIYSKLINGTYPNYDRVIPKDNNQKLQVNKDLFISTLRRVSIFSSSLTHQVRLIISKNQMTIRSEDIEFGAEGKETIDASFTDESLHIGYNSNYLMDVLRHIEHEDVIFEVKDSLSSAIIYPAEQNENENHIMLLMPIRLNEETGESTDEAEEEETEATETETEE